MVKKKKNQKMTRKLSLIMPFYRQEKTVVESLTKAQQVLESTRYDYEILAVIDGFDDKSYERAKSMTTPKIRVYGYKKNRGKGYALRLGMNKSRGDIIAFIDGGRDLDPVGIQMLLAHYEWYDADIIVGSKWHPVSKITYPLWRRIISVSYGLLVKMLFGLRIKDTQLGMKLYRREVVEKVLPKLTIEKFALDIEFLAVADRMGFHRIYESPVELDWHDIDSSISKSIVRSIGETLWDTLRVYYRLKILKQYD